MALEFKVKEVADAYEALVDVDVRVSHLASAYDGPLSNITLKMAQALVSGGNTLIKEKGTAKTTPLKADDNKK